MSLPKINWNGHDNLVSKLWRYNQHYFDDLNAIGSLQRKAWHNQLLQHWINENMVGKGVGWEPYPTSLRIVNWIKWQFSGNTLSDHFIYSLALQTRWLNKRIEWHILGNHLFSNAKALVFSGLFFLGKESDVWLKKGLKIINKELNEQVLGDGGHFERSPMYHSIFLEDLLDLINISQAYPNIIEDFQVNEWINVTKKMLRWLMLMTHPDSKISFFNDAAFGVVANFKELKKYARRLTVKYNHYRFDKVTHLPDSGYIRITNDDSIAILDVAPIGPDYLPGHAHADTLSFEISLFNQRFLVNSGVSEYGISSVRQDERSTKAHNTVVVNNENSSEIWNGFRVARRAYPFDLKIQELENFLNINCAHDGYKRLGKRIVHRRNWQFFDHSLIIKDQVEGLFKYAHSYLHFHPSINIIKIQNSLVHIEMSNRRKITLKIIKGKPQIRTSYYSCEFGKRLKNKCLKIALDRKEGAIIQILW